MDIFANDLRGFLALASYCNALIGNEGGAINMAKALSIPTFSIFSPWIDKNTWSIFEDDYNVSVHLKDFKPEIYRNKEEKKLKKDALSLYNDFKPSYFTKKLEQFLDTILNK
jgi:heptosyltransferase-2